jgi:hypothetical protein
MRTRSPVSRCASLCSMLGTCRGYSSILWRKLLTATADGNVHRSLVTGKEMTNYWDEDQIIDEMKLRLTHKDAEIRNLEDLIQVQQQIFLKLFNEKPSEQEQAEHGFISNKSVEGKGAKGVVSCMAPDENKRIDCKQGVLEFKLCFDRQLKAESLRWENANQGVTGTALESSLERKKLIGTFIRKLEEQQRIMGCLRKEITDLKERKDNTERIIIDEMKNIVQDLQAQVKEKFDANYTLISTIKMQRETIDQLRLSNILEKHQSIHRRMPNVKNYRQGQLVTSNCIDRAIEEGHLIFDQN